LQGVGNFYKKITLYVFKERRNVNCVVIFMLVGRKARFLFVYTAEVLGVVVIEHIRNFGGAFVLQE
jgi:hypothetical protein